MAVLIFCLAIALPAHARDTRHLVPIAIAMETKDAQVKLDGSIKFYFGDLPPPQVLTMLGSDVSNRKTPSGSPTKKPATGHSCRQW